MSWLLIAQGILEKMNPFEEIRHEVGHTTLGKLKTDENGDEEYTPLIRFNNFSGAWNYLPESEDGYYFCGDDLLDFFDRDTETWQEKAAWLLEYMATDGGRALKLLAEYQIEYFDERIAERNAA
jgi:hypothetical protein